jgi:tetratricopeptide (TPR) repeat protein
MAEQKDAREFTRLGDALANGHLQREPARAQLQRARQLAQRAVAVAPESSAAYKALGFVSSAQGQFEPALGSYERAVQLDHDAWGAMINTGDLLEIMGRGDEALPYFERAYAAMSRAYARNPVQVRPWYASLGVLVAERYRARGDLSAAETWYRRVLAESPMQRDAVRGLAAVLRKGGDSAGAERLCMELERRLGPDPDCQSKTHLDPAGI